MLDLFELLQIQQEKLRQIPELLGILANQSEESIAIYDNGMVRDLDDAVKQMLPNTVLVVYDGSGFSEFGEATRLKHDFRIIIRADRAGSTEGQAGYLEIYRSIVNGVPDGETEKFFDLKLVPDVEPINYWEFRSSSDADSLEYWQLTYGIIEVGA